MATSERIPSADERLRQEQMTGVGGTDAAAIVGVHPYKSYVQAYLQKLGQLPEIEDNERMYWGRKLEPMVAERFAEEHPTVKVRRRNTVWRHKDRPWQLGHVDRVIVDKGPRGNGILEIKTTDRFNADQWEDGDCPDFYAIQLHHYLMVSGYQWGVLAVLIGGNEYREVEIQRDERLYADLTDLETEFWERVQRREPPMPDGSEQTTQLLKRLYPQATDATSIVVEEDVMADVRRYKELLAAANAAETDKNALANVFRMRMGTAEALFVPSLDKPLVTWKNGTRRAFDETAFKTAFPDLHRQFVTEQPTRTLRFAKLKE